MSPRLPSTTNASPAAGKAPDKMMVESVELGAVIDSMSVGPVDISEDSDLRFRATLGRGKTPVLYVRSR